ncbi:hypothetical protein J2S08_002126 [Bacillus chungangensis]|uniref:Uncharacterized protein n=1 Tax=Bacillus chungangensis TaxID=587633 RepID=A0ABT9WSL5_9BACI|nr:hypothetical protein [Bacillus chungangensis]
MEGKKEILGLWLNETESKHKWIQILMKLRHEAWKHLLSLNGWSQWIRGRYQGYFSLSHRAALHRPFDPSFHQIRTKQGL